MRPLPPFDSMKQLSSRTFLLLVATVLSEMLAAARKNQPEMTEGERHFGLDNHSLLPQLGRSPRLSLDTL